MILCSMLPLATSTDLRSTPPPSIHPHRVKADTAGCVRDYRRASWMLEPFTIPRKSKLPLSSPLV